MDESTPDLNAPAAAEAPQAVAGTNEDLLGNASQHIPHADPQHHTPVVLPSSPVSVPTPEIKVQPLVAAVKPKRKVYAWQRNKAKR